MSTETSMVGGDGVPGKSAEEVAAEGVAEAGVIGRLRASVGIGVAAYSLVAKAITAGVVTEVAVVEETGLAPRQLDLLWDAMGAVADDTQGRRHRSISIPVAARQELSDYFAVRDERLRARYDGPGLDDAIGQLSPMVASLPTAKAYLDQVPASVETLVDRVKHLDHKWDLAGADVLFLGDHDGTSLALAHFLGALCTFSVVDVDHDLLASLRATFGTAPANPLDSAPLRWSAAQADLRVGLPAAAVGAFDVVVTDPPYTAEGVALFIRSARAALKPGMSSRIVLHYGASALTPGLMLGVQRAIAEAGLVIEALLPGFSRYRGAYAIGARSDLYVLRPVAKAVPAGPPAEWNVYTHGPESEEAGTAENDSRPTLSDNEVAALLGSAQGFETPQQIGLAHRHRQLLVPVLLATRGRLRALTCDNDAASVRSAQEQQDLRAALSGQYSVDRIERSVDGGRTTRLHLGRPEPGFRGVWASVSMRPHSKLSSSIADALVGTRRYDDEAALTKRSAKDTARLLSQRRGLGPYRLIDLETSCILAIQEELLRYQRVPHA